MAQARLSNRLDRAVEASYDHVLGVADAPVTLVEYGSYDCPYCRAANERIAEVRDQLGDRLRYVFRHIGRSPAATSPGAPPSWSSAPAIPSSSGMRMSP